MNVRVDDHFLRAQNPIHSDGLSHTHFKKQLYGIVHSYFRMFLVTVSIK